MPEGKTAYCLTIEVSWALLPPSMVDLLQESGEQWLWNAVTGEHFSSQETFLPLRFRLRNIISFRQHSVSIHPNLYFLVRFVRSNQLQSLLIQFGLFMIPSDLVSTTNRSILSNLCSSVSCVVNSTNVWGNLQPAEQVALLLNCQALTLNFSSI